MVIVATLAPITRRNLVEKIVNNMMSDERFLRTMQGLTLGQMNEVVNMILDARKEVFNERTKQTS